jgi:hypothetical protein
MSKPDAATWAALLALPYLTKANPDLAKPDGPNPTDAQLKAALKSAKKAYKL